MGNEAGAGLEERRVAIIRDAIDALNRGDWDEPGEFISAGDEVIAACDEGLAAAGISP